LLLSDLLCFGDDFFFFLDIVSFVNMIFKVLKDLFHHFWYYCSMDNFIYECNKFHTLWFFWYGFYL